MTNRDAAVADLLGIRAGTTATSPLGLVTTIERGLPVSVLERVSRRVAPTATGFIVAKIISKATLARRKQSAARRLSLPESDRVARLARVWALACDTWGTEEAARSFLFRSHPLLGGRQPIDVALTTGLGTQLVEDIIGRLKYGSAA